MCFETFLTPVCPTCLKEDGEPGYESIRCPEAKEKWLGIGKCSQVPPIKYNKPEEYLNPGECIPCSQVTWDRKQVEEAEKERLAEEERSARVEEEQRRYEAWVEEEQRGHERFVEEMRILEERARRFCERRREEQREEQREQRREQLREERRQRQLREEFDWENQKENRSRRVPSGP